MEPKTFQLLDLHHKGEAPVQMAQLYKADHHDFNLVTVAPGTGKPPHPHMAGDSFMLVLTGLLHLHVDGETYDLGPGHLAIIPKGAVRGFTAGPDGVTMFASHLRA